ncbi:hypothetical protein B296_00029705 [Ensete ventricosum]|uniref:Uncharacterized protein n=1 Tax=Ensete ventricosum TaxID=4639 RepID=A0A426ZGF7_ENSVE|nr:hypothetical protein B296_00029705 [Ensete ventricosum]
MFTSLLLLQEDVPDEFASLIINFITRNRIGPNGVEVNSRVNRTNTVEELAFEKWLRKLRSTSGRRNNFSIAKVCMRRWRSNFSRPASAAIADIRDPQEGQALERVSSLSTVIADEQLEGLPDRFQRPGSCDMMCNVRDGSSLRASPEHRSRTQDRIGWGGGMWWSRRKHRVVERSRGSSSPSEATDVEEKESGSSE